RRLVAHVTCDGERRPAGRLDLGHRALGPVSHHVHDHNAVALPREVQRHLPGDGTPGTGDDHDSWLATRVGHVKLLNGAPTWPPGSSSEGATPPRTPRQRSGRPGEAVAPLDTHPGFKAPSKPEQPRDD